MRELAKLGKAAVVVVVVVVARQPDRLRRSPKWAAVAAEVVVVWREEWMVTVKRSESVCRTLSGSVNEALIGRCDGLACEGQSR